MSKLTPLEQLKDLVKVQRSDGNWNYDPYMHGMANGMILAEAIMEGRTPEYLEAPNEWLCDRDAEDLKQKGTSDAKGCGGSVLDHGKLGGGCHCATEADVVE